MLGSDNNTEHSLDFEFDFEFDDVPDTPSELPTIIPINFAKNQLLLPNRRKILFLPNDNFEAFFEEAKKCSQCFGFAIPKFNNEGQEDGIYDAGTLGIINKITPGENATRIVCDGIRRFKIEKIMQTEPFIVAKIKYLSPEKLSKKWQEDIDLNTVIVNIRMEYNELLDAFGDRENILEDYQELPDNPMEMAEFLSDVVEVYMDYFPAKLQSEFLKSTKIYDQLLVLLEMLRRHTLGTHLRCGNELTRGDNIERERLVETLLGNIESDMDKLNTMGFDTNGRVGGGCGMDEELDKKTQELIELAKNKKLPTEARNKINEELDALRGMHPQDQEAGKKREYIKLILKIPWSEHSKDNLDLGLILKLLKKEHFGLDKVNNRIVEEQAPKILNPKIKAATICFVGPPGVGKTSLGRAIAKALGREFVRISLGGVRDEAEIRGHNYTYLGSKPGRIIKGMIKAGTNNPVFMMDEIDKVGADSRGDPSSALLEVLDMEQNYAFSEHYIDLDYDLSHVLFITTANTIDTIPDALLDRMEVIELPGYTEKEKIRIAIRHLIPRQIKEKGLGVVDVIFHKKAIKMLINRYTYEAGVRNLERQIANICRKVARNLVTRIKPLIIKGQKTELKIPKNLQRIVVTKDIVREYLGIPPHDKSLILKNIEPGVVAGLACTDVEGEILYIESSIVNEGFRELEITGSLKDVMEESARNAITVVQNNKALFGIAEDFSFKDKKIHISTHDGAIPKDGPSAGAALVTSLVSAITGKRAYRTMAMTGEITLSGLVMKVGGINRKILGAQRAGIKTIIIPEANAIDLQDIDKAVLDSINIETVTRIEEVLAIALQKRKYRIKK